MASKFTGMLKPKPGTVEPETPMAVEVSPEPAPKNRGRPPKKSALSNDPAYRPTNFYVNVDNYADAHARLRKERSGRNMSDLINELLADWLETPVN